MKKRCQSYVRKWNCREGARPSKFLPMRHHGVSAAVCLAASLSAFAACERAPDSATEPRPPGPFEDVESPAGPGSRTPRFAAADGRVLLSWQTIGTADTTTVRFASLRGETWTKTRTVVSSPALFANWADYPSVVSLGGDTLAAHWLQYNGPGTYAYQVRLALSRDGGATWSQPIIPHETETQTEHGFVTLLPRSGGLEAFWLDGRAYEGGTQEMSLRTTRIGVDGSLGRETVLDSRTCDCCQTAAAVLGDTIVVAYRGRSREEIRDIEVVRRIDGEWTEPVRVRADDWRIDACPVNGPAMAVVGDQVLLTWFTAAGGEARVYGAMSMDGGGSFGPGFVVDDGQPIGRVAVVPLADRRFAVAWVEALDSSAGGAEVRVRLVSADGTMSPSAAVARGVAGRASGFPSLVELEGDLLVAWTDTDAGVVRLSRGMIR